MARFIPIKQMQTLRESARSGDERAKRILAMQLSGTEDFSQLLEEYFAPQPEPEISTEQPAVMEQKATEPVDKALGQETPFEMYLRENEITLDENNRNDVIREFEEMTGNKAGMPEQSEEKPEGPEYEELVKKLMKEESDAVDSYSKAITQVMNCDCLDDTQKRRFIARCKEIRGDEEEHFRELRELLSLSNEQDEEKETKL